MPPVNDKAKPSTTDDMPKVIIKAGTLNQATPMPLTRPMPAQAQRPATQPIKIDSQPDP